MVKKYKKFILKSPMFLRGKLYKVEKDIFDDNLSQYDLKSYEWFKNQYRIRIWNYRIIFEKSDLWNKIIKINKRWDIY